MSKNNFDWNKFSLSIILSSDIKKIYKYIATSGGITKWFIGNAIYTSSENKVKDNSEFIQENDIYFWKWYNKNLELKGKILEANNKDFIKFTFGVAGTVSINLENKNDRTLFTLTQETYPESTYDKFSHINCYVCWAFFITNLKSVAEYEIDLRESKSDLDGLINL